MRPDEYQEWDELGSNFFSLSNSLWALVPLEAWRRGLQIQLQPNARYTISDGNKSLSFRQTRLSGQKQDAIAKICDDKQATKELLIRSQVSTPKGRYFSPPFDREKIVGFADELGYPVCLKPNSWAKARGVFPKVPDNSSFRRLLDHLLDDLHCPEILVEEHIQGSNVRVFVAGDRVVAASSMSPASVVGDGFASLRKLVDQKNIERQVNPHLGGCKIVLDEEVNETLRSAGLELESVVGVGEKVYLRKSANISKGGDSHDVTASLSPKIAQMAIKTIQSVPGLEHGGVDILTLNPTDNSSLAMVNEINPSAGLGPHLYPGTGDRIDVPASIIDHYFPSSKRLETSVHWYFALSQILRMFSSETASHVTVSPMPQISNISWRTVRVMANKNEEGRVRRQLLNLLPKLAIHGHLTKFKDDHFDVSLAGSARTVDAAIAEIRSLGHILKPVTKKAFKVSPGFRSM